MPLSLNPLSHPLCLTRPHRTKVTAWLQHIPFAFLTVDLLRPRLVVELGVHYGASYCAFCQAVAQLSLATRCYGIDTWEGDAQAGYYGPEVLADLRGHHDELYGGFSTLIQSSFDGAVGGFADGTIDLLHIDGYHTYQAVKHDFETWRPKLSERGVVLFHDVNVRDRESFGVWRFWDEIKGQYPSFEFLHCYGLGVLGVGTEIPEAFGGLLTASEQEVGAVRAFFYFLGYALGANTEEVKSLQGRLHEAHVALDGKQKELDGKQKELDGKQKELDGKQKELDGLHQHVARQGQQTQADFAAQQEDLRAWKVRAAQTDEVVATLQALLAERDGRLGAADGRLHDQGRQLAQLQGHLAEKDHALLALHACLEGRHREDSAHQRELEDLWHRLEGKQRELEDFGRERVGRQRELDTARRELGNLWERVGSVEAYALRLERELAAQRHDTAALRDSWTWRVGRCVLAPSRPLKRLLRG